MLPQRLANFAFFAVAAVTIVASDDPAADTAAPEPTAEALATAAVEDTEGFAVMPTPRPGEWLARFEEEHVTLDE